MKNYGYLFLFTRFALAIVLAAIATRVEAASPYTKDVCASGCTFSSVQSAIDAITDSDATKVYTVFVDAGVISSDTSITTNGKDYINFVGRGMGTSIVQASANWFINNAGAAHADFFDISGSTNVTLSGLSIDARTKDPGGYGPTTIYAGVLVSPPGAGRVTIEGSEILGATYGLWSIAGSATGLVDVLNSKIQATEYGVNPGSSETWHIFACDIRATDNGGTSGPITVVNGIAHGSSSDVTIWGSHIHAESSQAGKSYEIVGIHHVLGTLTMIGSTVHVKMTTSSIGASNRNMFSILTGGGKVNLIGDELLYENTNGTLSQGRLAGLGFLNTAPETNLIGVTFRDGGGSGGTSRSDLYALVAGNANIRMVGTKVGTFASISGAGPTNTAREFDTLGNQKGSSTFASSSTLAVTLPVTLPDTNYRVSLSSNRNETVWVTSKTSTGFTLNSSNASSTATVEWMLMR